MHHSVSELGKSALRSFPRLFYSLAIVVQSASFIDAQIPVTTPHPPGLAPGDPLSEGFIQSLETSLGGKLLPMEDSSNKGDLVLGSGSSTHLNSVFPSDYPTSRVRVTPEPSGIVLTVVMLLTVHLVNSRAWLRSQ